ncbi:MAG: hypothetical protein JJE22_09810, partial [Bacteroidia bacterium]|nr:hypothetical protein [Bacteroidia bacterium]
MEQPQQEFPLMQGKVIDMTPSLGKNRVIARKGLENIVLKMEDVLLFYTENKVIYLLDKF